MNRHETIGIFDYDRNKICDIYDSQIDLVGQAYDISVVKEWNGTHSLSFKLPYMMSESVAESGLESAIFGIAKFGQSKFGEVIMNMGNQNFRWMFMKSDYLIRYTCGSETIWFVASKPEKHKTGNSVYGSITCNGYESLLKTRNIYMSFDDENGIGTVEYLMTQILRGTGWTYNSAMSDTPLERDGVTEKIRSLKSDGKKGALDLISTTCNLFQVRPIFDTENMTVTIKAINNRVQVLEGEVGRNMTALSVKNDSSDIVTRLYVEGEYGDYGYVGIDDVKVDEYGEVDPTGTAYGLPFIVNFDYYRELGVFKARHETALATYLTDIKAKKAEIRANGALMIAADDAINEMIGQCKMALYYSASLTTPAYTYGGITAEQAALHGGDEVYILLNNGKYTKTTWTGSSQLSSAYGVAKFATPSAGKIGAAEVQIEAKGKSIDALQRKINVTVAADKIAEYKAEILRIRKEIEAIYTGYTAYSDTSAYAVNDKCSHNTGYDQVTYSYDNANAYKCTTAIPTPSTTHAWNASEWTQITPGGLWKMMHDVMKSNGLLYQYDHYYNLNIQLNEEQDDIEATFIAAMGYMLRDGYWNDNNYTVGQEEYLYADALDISREMGRPRTDYSFSYARITEDFGVPAQDIEINAIFKIYDPELEIDDKLFIKRISYGVDKKNEGNIEVSNQDITLTGNDLGSLLSRMSQLADLIEQKNALYERAKALNADGSIFMDRLNGQIDVVKNKILSSVSNWYTDDNGNIVFISADDSSAMMLSGAGFMLANSKTESGDWNWRTKTYHWFSSQKCG